MDKLKLGVIGAGGIVCRMHLPDLTRGDDLKSLLLVADANTVLNISVKNSKFRVGPRITMRLLQMIHLMLSLLVRHIRCMSLGALKHWKQVSMC